MTESIQQKIDQISSTVKKMAAELSDLRMVNTTLKTEVQKSQVEVQSVQSDLVQCQSELEERSAALMKVNEQNNHSSLPVNSNKDQEIDELVKEIEYCISQLKK